MQEQLTRILATQAQLIAGQARQSNDISWSMNSSVIADSHRLRPLRDATGALPSEVIPEVWFPLNKGNLTSASDAHLNDLMNFYQLVVPVQLHPGELIAQRRRRAVAEHIGLR